MRKHTWSTLTTSSAMHARAFHLVVNTSTSAVYPNKYIRFQGDKLLPDVVKHCGSAKAKENQGLAQRAICRSMEGSSAVARRCALHLPVNRCRDVNVQTPKGTITLSPVIVAWLRLILS